MTTTIDLTRGMPPASTFPTEDLIHCCEKVLRRDGHTLMQYGRSPGYAPLKEWIAAYHQTTPARVFMGNSSLEIFAFITQAMLPRGARVFVERPTYDRSILLLRRAGMHIVDIPIEQDGVNLEQFEEELKRESPHLVYLITDFQNPMGITTSLSKRQQLAKWAEEYDFLIVEDGPYRALRYKGEQPPTLYSIAPQRVLHLSSFSKLLAPGLRTGYMVGNETAVSKLTEWAINTYIGPVTLTQGMVYEYCVSGLLEKNIEKLKRLYAPKLESIQAALQKYLPDVSRTHPEGGYYVSLNLPESVHMDALLANTASVGLKLSDGRGFFVNPADGERFLRIPFCSVEPEDIEPAVVRLSQLIG